MVPLSFPPTNAGMLAWSQNVVNLITPVPATYGLVTLDVTTFTALHDTYSTTLLACDPSVRSKFAVVAKNQALANLKAGAILLANKVYSSPTVSDAQKTQLGMPPRATPQRIGAPTTAPVIEVIYATGWTVRIRLRDAEGARRGKPPGTFGASIFSYAGENPPGDINAWHFEGSAGKVAKIDITLPTTLAAGTKIWLTAFWFSGRKESGPAATPVNFNLPGGGVMVTG